jgi:5-methylcytosine-specific restriction endonuclease McrA
MRQETNLTVETGGIIPTGQPQTPTRAGPRDEIPWRVRLAVYRRDEFICRLCGLRDPKPRHLDHVTPWSLGGSDRTENLRLLCEPCNMDRGNRDDGTDRIRYLPCTWECFTCTPTVREQNGRLTFAYCATCEDTGYAAATL